MQILHVISRLSQSWGGLSLFVAELARQQAATGKKVSILCESENPKDPDWQHGYLNKSAVKPFDRLWHNHFQKADLIHVHGLWLPRYHFALSEARKLRKPHIVSPHGMLEPGALEFSRWRKLLAWWFFQHRDLKLAPMIHVTAQSELITVRSHGLKQATVIIPPGVSAPPANYRSACNYSPQAPRTALFLGRLHPKKGVRELIEAWASARPKGWRLEIGGPDEAGLTTSIRELARQRKISNEVVFLGPLFGDLKEQAFARAEILVIPSKSENFGIVVAEGLIRGLPVITTKGTPWNVLAEKGFGWWVDFSIEGLAGALREASVKSPDDLRSIGSGGQDWAAANFAWNAIEQRMELAYKVLCDG